jgi:hypothetical protein
LLGAKKDRLFESPAHFIHGFVKRRMLQKRDSEFPYGDTYLYVAGLHRKSDCREWPSDPRDLRHQ